MSSKVIKVKVPEKIWETFFRLFPGKGERSVFLRRCIKIGIELREEQDTFGKKLRELLEEELHEDE